MGLSASARSSALQQAHRSQGRGHGNCAFRARLPRIGNSKPAYLLPAIRGRSVGAPGEYARQLCMRMEGFCRLLGAGCQSGGASCLELPATKGPFFETERLRSFLPRQGCLLRRRRTGAASGRAFLWRLDYRRSGWPVQG